jgi:integrase/recombinase XerC
LKAFEAYLKQTDDGLGLRDVDADLVRGWAMNLMSAGMKATSVNRKLSSLRTFYKYLLKKGLVEVSPMQSVHGPKRTKPLPQFVREADMERMLSATAQGDTWQEVREHVILQLFYETGIRLSELVGLNVEDVDFGRQTIKVTGKRNKQRIIPIGQGMADSLKRYMEMRDRIPSPLTPLFTTDKGERIYPRMVYGIVRKNLSQVVTLKKRSPHVLRHTFATVMLNNEAELEAVKELMGHESVSTTQIYTHTTFEELKKAYSQAHPRANINQ